MRQTITEAIAEAIPYDARAALMLPCYVSGCYQLADRCAIHQHRGQVRTCAGHDPNRHGYGVAFTRRQVPGFAAAMTSRPDVGPQPPVRPMDRAPDPTPAAPVARVLSFTFGPGPLARCPETGRPAGGGPTPKEIPRG